MQTADTLTSQTPDTPEFRQILALLWRWVWLILLTGLAAGIIGLVVSLLMTPVYQASTTVLVNEAPAVLADSYSAVLASDRLTRTYAEMIVKQPVLESVSADLGLTDRLDALEIKVSAQPLRDTPLIKITVESTDPQVSAAAANQIVSVFAAQILALQSARFAQSEASLVAQISASEQELADYAAQAALSTDEQERSQLDARIAQLREIYAGLVQSYEQVRLAKAQAVSSIAPVEAASAPAEPIRPKPLRSALLAGMLGLMLCAGVILVRVVLDDTLKSPADVAVQLGLPVLGVIGRHASADGGLISVASPRSPVAEAFRTLRANLQPASHERPLVTLLVTSAEPMAGKTTVAANLAVAAAQAGQRTLLIDCDLRHPTLQRVFGLVNLTGLARLFEKSQAMIDGACQRTRVEDLRVLTSGEMPPNPAELLGSPRMRSILAEAAAKAELVILDTPPALAVVDASLLARYADGVLLIIRPGQTRTSCARRTLEQLYRVNARILGVVVNNLDKKDASYGLNYDYYGKNGDSGYYSNKPVNKEKNVRTIFKHSRP
jgi:capsular exopolysaccharide synthesis family protein